jgi:hypothetical protein
VLFVLRQALTMLPRLVWNQRTQYLELQAHATVSTFILTLTK